jgi:hypothetical protein
MKTMRANVFHGKDHIALEEVPRPHAGTGEGQALLGAGQREKDGRKFQPSHFRQTLGHMRLPSVRERRSWHRKKSVGQNPGAATSLDLALTAVFAHVAGLFEIPIVLVRLDRGFLGIGAELVGDFFWFRFHEESLPQRSNPRRPSIAQDLPDLVPRWTRTGWIPASDVRHNLLNFQIFDHKPP